MMALIEKFRRIGVQFPTLVQVPMFSMAPAPLAAPSPKAHWKPA
jgi:hypothetical protein